MSFTPLLITLWPRKGFVDDMCLFVFLSIYALDYYSEFSCRTLKHRLFRIFAMVTS